MSEKIVSEDEAKKTAMARLVRADAAREIEENLKRVYQASLSQDVPDRFVQLLAQLREKEGKT